MLRDKAFFLVVGFAIYAMLLHSCAPSKSVKPNKEFSRLSYAKELISCKKAVVQGFKKKDVKYPIYLLNYGVLAQYSCKMDSARSALLAASKIEEAKLSEVTQGVEWIKSDQKRVYKVTKRESELMHFYLGLNYFMSNKPDKALVEFKKLELIDQKASLLPIVSFYLGKCYEVMQKSDDARIEYDKLLSMISTEEFPFVFLMLAQLESGFLEDDESKIYFSKYCDIAKKTYEEIDAENIVKKRGWGTLIVQIDHQWSNTMGFGELWVDDEYVGKIKPFDYFKVKMTSGEKSRKAAKEVGSYIARKTVRNTAENIVDNLMPGFGCLGGYATDALLGSEDEDKENRYWNYAPTGFSLTLVPVPKNFGKLRIEFYDAKSSRIGSVVYKSSSCQIHQTSGNFIVEVCLDNKFYIY